MKGVRKRYVHSTLAVVLLSAALTQRGEAQTAAQFEGKPIANIVFEPASQPLEGRELFALLPVKRNELYRAADVRTAIERLYATGRYQDIQVDASPIGNSVLVRFVTKSSWFIGAVAAESHVAAPPSQGQIVNAARLQLGDPFDPAQIPPAVANIRKLLVDNGYFDPVVEPQLEYDQDYQQVHITFSIEAGKRAHYTDPEFAGNTTIVSKNDLIKASRWRHLLRPGYDGITATGTRTGVEQIRLKYEKVNRVLATVVLNRIAQIDSRHGQPQVTVNPGPLVEVKTTGAKLSQGQLRENIPIYEEHTIDPDLLGEGTTNLRNYFQSQGYFDASVTFQGQRMKGETIEIDYVVNRGIRHRVESLVISGNHYFSTATIRERMFISPPTFELRNGRYSEAFRRRDTEAIQRLYESNGFRDAKVLSHIVDNYKGRERDLAIYFDIEEGPQYRVSQLDIKGTSGLDLTKLRRSLNSQPGQPFSEFNVATDRETILDEYGKHGFAQASFEWDSAPGAGPHTVALVFTIHEGEQQFVRQVVISGLKATHPDVVNRQIELNPGSPLSPEAMADTQRRLEALGIFSQVDMAVQNPEGQEDRKYVVYDLAEASRYSIATGAGLEFARIGGSNAAADLSDPGGGAGVTPRVTLDATRINFLGRGESLNFQGRLSTLQKRALLNYIIPQPRDHARLDLRFSLLYDDTYDVRTFQSKRAEASAQLQQRVSKTIRLFYGLIYRDANVSNLKIDPKLVPQVAQSVRVGLTDLNFVHDRRDDPVDPHKGIFNTVDIRLATRALGSQTSFARVLGRNATYYRLGPKIVFARQTQLGLQPAIGSAADVTPNDPIPLAERFFSGGANTDRGFPENQAGPRDPVTGFPLGGSALFFNSTELRFPLFGTDLNGVLFEDAGNVFTSLGAITFRVDQRSISDFDYMVHAAGFGLRYRTPIGPLRLDLAYSINPPRFNGFPGNYSQLVACSAANTCQASPQQINHFQFFLSIGQAF